MTARHWNDHVVRLTILAVALAVAGWHAAPAAELDKLDSSLKLIPADAAFYSSNLRNREQFDILRGSNVWKKIEQMPAVQMGLSMYNAQLSNSGSAPAKLAAALKNPEVRKIVDLAIDMVSDEIFVYGDDSCIEFLKLVQDVAGAVRYGPMVMQATAQAEGGNSGQMQAKMLVSALAEHVDLLDVPNVVVGFKVKNTDLAKEQLIKLEMFGNLLEANEKTKGHFKKTKIGDHDYLVLDLDGGMAPWEQAPMEKLKELELEEGDAQKIVDKLKEAKLAIAIGLRGNYLVLSIGSSLECLEKLGQDKRLIDREEFRPLEKFADKRLASIGYVSEDLNQQANNQQQNIDNLLQLVDKLLPLAKLDEQQNERVRKDAEGLSQDLKGLLPEVGALMGFGFLSERGVECYRYAWGEHGRIDGSKPLGLLQHLGGNPILAVVSRVKAEVEDYDLMVKWLKTGYGYFEDFALPSIPEADREKVKKFLAGAMPLVQRMDKANREMLIPAMADGQSAVVIDGKLRSKQFVAALPATEKPMPMIEPALVMGISDAKLLKQGLREYRASINGLIDAMRGVEGVEVPENVRIPEPQTVEGPLGTIYSFVLPKPWGVDEKIVPNMGISKDVVVVSMSADHTERLLKGTPLAAGGTLLKADRPLAAAVWLDWAALVDAAAPWVDYGLQQAAASKGVAEDQRKAIAEQVGIGLEVLKALRSISSESYLEDEVLVNHTLLEIRDVGK